jgi:hypothetical protein
MVFGVKALPEVEGSGWKALVDWTWRADKNLCEVTINLDRATEAGAKEWISQFVCAVIAECG